MSYPRDYPDVITSAESGRPLYRGLKTLTFEFEGKTITYEQPGWWASFDDPTDTEGQLVDEDNLVWRSVRNEARNK